MRFFTLVTRYQEEVFLPQNNCWHSLFILKHYLFINWIVNRITRWVNILAIEHLFIECNASEIHKTKQVLLIYLLPSTNIFYRNWSISYKMADLLWISLFFDSSILWKTSQFIQKKVSEEVLDVNNWPSDKLCNTADVISVLLSIFVEIFPF